MLTALLVSQGVPMITMGDEYGHTRKGPLQQATDSSFFRWDHVGESPEVRLHESICCVRIMFTL